MHMLERGDLRFRTGIDLPCGSRLKRGPCRGGTPWLALLSSTVLQTMHEVSCTVHHSHVGIPSRYRRKNQKESTGDANASLKFSQIGKKNKKEGRREEGKKEGRKERKKERDHAV